MEWIATRLWFGAWFRVWGLGVHSCWGALGFRRKSAIRAAHQPPEAPLRDLSDSLIPVKGIDKGALWALGFKALKEAVKFQVPKTLNRMNTRPVWGSGMLFAIQPQDPTPGS